MGLLTRRAMRVTAALSALRQSQGDVLDALVPFFEPILEVMNGTVFDPRLLAAGVEKLYRWRFTPDVAEQFIPRLVHKGYLRREGHGREGVYIVVFQPSPDDGDNSSVSVALRDILDRFEDFAPVVSDLLHYAKNRDQLADILVQFLLSVGAFGENMLTEVRQITAVGGPATTGVLSRLPEGGPTLSTEDRYIAARFVQEMCREDPANIDAFRQIASVGLLAEVVDDFVRPTTISTAAELTIVIDAPLALDYLGLSGDALKADVRAVLEPLKRIGCNLIVFPITCDEMTRNLESMLALRPPNRHGPTHHAMVRGDIDNDFVVAVARDPERALNNSGVTVRPVDLTSFPNSHHFFSAEVYQDFLSYVTWVSDWPPRIHDATCLALLMRLRGGRNSTDLLRSQYVFVTRNSAFAREARKYCLSSRMISERHESPVIHQRELAMVAWLRTGLDAEGAIPKTALIAACERVLRVRKEVTAAVAAKLRQVTTQDKLEQFELLLLDQRSVQRLADTTLNDERVVTAENAEKLLEVMRQATAAEAKAEYDASLRRVREEQRVRQQALAAEHEARTVAARAEVEAVQRGMAAAAAALDNTRDEARQLQERLARQRKAIAGRINRQLRWISRVTTFAMILLGGVAIVNMIAGDGQLGRYASWIGAIVGAVGVYYLLAEMLHWPKVGLTTVLSLIAEWRLRREYIRLDIPEERSMFVVNEGRISVLEGGASGSGGGTGGG